MNNYTAVGRLGNDPVVKQLDSGKSVCNFSLAVTVGKDKTLWLKCEAWDKTGETIGRFFAKGDMIAVNGGIKNSEAWLSKEDGTAKSSVVINVYGFSFCGSKSDRSTESSNDDLSGVPF